MYPPEPSVAMSRVSETVRTATFTGMNSRSMVSTSLRYSRSQRVALGDVTELVMTRDATRLIVPSMEATMSTTTTAKADLRSDRTGFIPNIGHLALDVIDRGQATTLGVLHDARTEIRTAVDHGIDLADKVAASTFRFAKKLVQRIDDAAADTLGSVERVINSALK